MVGKKHLPEIIKVLNNRGLPNDKINEICHFLLNTVAAHRNKSFCMTIAWLANRTSPSNKER